MNLQSSSLPQMLNSQEEAFQYLVQGHYIKAASLYEQLINTGPEVSSHYWYLGLVLLLQGEEAEAQMTWLLAMEKAEADEVELWTVELIQILQTEATRQETLENYSVAWAIRQHIKEINLHEINNLLSIINLDIQLERFTDDELSDLEIIDILKTEENLELDCQLLLQVLQQLLEVAPLHTASLELLEVCLPYFSDNQSLLNILLPASMKIAYNFKQPHIAADILEFYLRLDPENREILLCLAAFYQNSGDYLKGIKTAKIGYSLAKEITDRIYGIAVVLRGLLSAGGYWQEVVSTCQDLENLMLALIENQGSLRSEELNFRLITPFFSIAHIKDEPATTRYILNQVSKIFETHTQVVFAENFERYYQQNLKLQQTRKSTKKIKIGYLSHCLRRHSVGWLARWLIQHHNRENFEIYIYFVNSNLLDDPLQDWYENEASYSRRLGMNSCEIADQINQDEIDILVDLDSVTLDITCEIMALKPAPLQLTWLGWDASGVPSIDYFIADPYVLPDSAQNYYTEKIWRLPQTYIAVDGFEVGVPTLRRTDLDIPSDAVVYLSAQRGYKRHPETTRWQMKIIKQVPNSYFLIKGDAEEEAIKEFFYTIAAAEGVDRDRLRFLPLDLTEAIHRANLAITDIVLDTSPYNGATTTLETLWMGIPLVTRVGEQFAARNSYTMMINAGITEGIAWTDEEYVEWGVRLGKDATLRQEISWKLRQSRHTAPLWNGKQFTCEMEKAYEQMWQKYTETNC
ncbi:MAG: O-linked N-acetylglucosamine transferase, SPINDLY family protein [Nostoc sp. ChiSLP02]|nr:O-linked N-acetylglucosamine transferase, SPINDLY family protein [Nostoc sp. DedSLP05]MDZ8101611.1 O-linked N-acetylglucosamine transferase, SPINDLY family protein [Nostoc sp. DedSLP01]MDZ8189543.1 O-linked N-acetylglucosamine transferase, SPINDLY family protein [Nostoc sp. ChiSLP02]